MSLISMINDEDLDVFHQWLFAKGGGHTVHIDYVTKYGRNYICKTQNSAKYLCVTKWRMFYWPQQYQCECDLVVLYFAVYVNKKYLKNTSRP
jgi:hypothetical protein